MTTEFLEALNKILAEDNVPQATINKVAIAIALDAKNSVIEHKLEQATKMGELRDSIQQQTDNIDKLTAVVAKHEEFQQTHPSLLWLLRFQTKKRSPSS